MGFAFRGDDREVFEVFAELQQALLVKEVISVTTFTYNKVTYSVPLVYRGSLSPSPFFMRYDHENSSLIVENATVAFDKERMLLMPVESFANNAPTEKSHHAALGKLKGLLADDVIRGADDAHLLAKVKADLEETFQNVLTEKLRPILSSAVKVQVMIR